MTGKWASSDRRARLPTDWPKLRAKARARATSTDPLRLKGGRCEYISPTTGRCLSIGNQCDHIDRQGPDELSNLQWLCYPHHHQKTLREAAEAKRAKAARGKRTPERHPGSIRRGNP